MIIRNVGRNIHLCASARNPLFEEFLSFFRKICIYINDMWYAETIINTSIGDCKTIYNNTQY